MAQWSPDMAAWDAAPRTAPQGILGTGADPIARLRPLLAAAAELHLDDGEGWSRFRPAARATTAHLAADGALPGHLVVNADDPPVVITRTIAAAWRHVTDAPSRCRPRPEY